MAGVPDPCVRELIRLTELETKPCRGCYHCLRNEDLCNIEADALIIGLPVYFLGPHASFKMLIDRMMGLGHYAEKTRCKPCVVVMSFGIPGWEGYTRTAALSLPRFLQMKKGRLNIHAGNIPLFPGTGRGRFSPEEICQGLEIHIERVS